jgi:hypothetical protein
VTAALVRRGVHLVAVEPDPVWCWNLRKRFGREPRTWTVESDFLTIPLPNQPFRVAGSLPFSKTTDILRYLLDDPGSFMVRADVVVQWEVARKRAAYPPSTLLSTIWAPWWEIGLRQRIPAADFRPIPRVDAGYLAISRRDPRVLPLSMARRYAEFVRQQWPFDCRVLCLRLHPAPHGTADRPRSIANFLPLLHWPIPRAAYRRIGMAAIFESGGELIREINFSYEMGRQRDC